MRKGHSSSEGGSQVGSLGPADSLKVDGRRKTGLKSMSGQKRGLKLTFYFKNLKGGECVLNLYFSPAP